MRIASVGHAVFAATMIGLGIMGLIKGDFSAVWQPVPKGFPGREALAYLCAVITLACGFGLLWQRSVATAARVLFAWLLTWMLVFKARFIILAPLVEGSYQSCGENAVIVAGAWILYAWFAADWDKQYLRFATGDAGLRLARVLYALAMIAFGLSHFFYLELTAPLVPVWICGVPLALVVCAEIAAEGTCCCAGFEAIAKPPSPPSPKITAAMASLVLRSFTAFAP